MMQVQDQNSWRHTKTKKPGSKAGFLSSDRGQTILEVALQADEAEYLVFSTVSIFVLNRHAGRETFGDLVVQGYASAPCVVVAEVERAMAQAVEVLNAGGDGQLVGGVEAVRRSNRPLRLFPVSVRVRSPDTSELEDARAEVSREQSADCAFFEFRVVTAEQVEGNAAERSRNDTGNANAVRVSRSTFEFVDRETGLERTAVIEVSDRVELGVVAERVGFAVQALIPPVVEEAGFEATQLDVGFVNVDQAIANVGVVVGVELSSEEAGERAVLGVALGVERDVSAREGIPIGVACCAPALTLVNSVITVVYLEADEAARIPWAPALLRR